MSQLLPTRLLIVTFILFVCTYALQQAYRDQMATRAYQSSPPNMSVPGITLRLHGLASRDFTC